MKSLFYYFIFFNVGNASANFEMNDACIKAYNEILNFRFDSGKQILDTEKRKNPSNKIPYYIENYIDFFKLFIGEDKKDLDISRGNKSYRLSQIEKGDHSSPYYLFTQAEIHLQWAFARLKFGEYPTAAYEVFRAYKLLTEVEKKFPGFLPAKKSLGLLHCMIGAIPDEYSWSKSIVGLKGSIPLGLSELNDFIKGSSDKKEFAFLNQEVLIIKSFIQLNLLNPETLTSFAIDPEKGLNASPLISFASATIALRTGRNDLAIQILQSRKKEAGAFPFHYLDYLTGTARLNKLDFGCKDNFKAYLLNFKGMNYKKSSTMKLGLAYLLEGDQNAYKNQLSKIPHTGKTLVDEDRQSEKNSKNLKIPNLLLLKSRLLFDGGYYEEAHDLLIREEKNNKPEGMEELLEYRYRLARIHHKSGNYPRARDYYKLTYDSGKKNPYYFAANSALQLGLIAEKNKDFSDAIFWFERCIELRDHEYRTSLQQKARAGLNRLEKYQKE